MKHLIMGTAGHIDHGKTSLIKALTNIDCDTHKEEKRRGITINLGFSYLDLPDGTSLGIIDVPGHKDFINTMVGGACGIDFVLLVIAADSGIMPQTIEHLNIIEALKIPKGIIVLTKTDLVDQDLLDIAKLEIFDFLANCSLKDSPVVAVSSTTGAGLDELINELQKISFEVVEKEIGNIFRMYADRIFSIKGMGSVVTGSVLNGEISVGNDVYMLPEIKQKFRIRSLERHGKAVNKVVAGDRAAINISGFKAEDFKKGMVLSDKIIPETRMIDCSLSLFGNVDKLNTWSTVSFHTGTFECQSKMHLLNYEKLEPGIEGIVQFHFEKPAVVQINDKFIIRNSSGDISLGGGIVIDNNPLHHKRITPKLVENISILASSVNKENNISDLIKLELNKFNKPMLLKDIYVNINKPPEEILKSLETPDNDFVVYKTDDIILVSGSANERYKNQIINKLKEFHQRNKIFSHGMDISELSGKIGLAKDKTGKIFIEALLKDLVTENKLKKFENTWILCNHLAVIDEKSLKEISFIESEILNYGLQKPVMNDIEQKASELGINKDSIKMYLYYLLQNKKLYYLNNEYLHSSVVDKIRPVLLKELINKSDGINLSEFRQLIDATKKICPVLLGIYESEKVIITIPQETTKIIKITESGKKIFR
ncbi:MAG: selenocysteine-specific translation elongation factor [Bacteroidota bacterium]